MIPAPNDLPPAVEIRVPGAVTTNVVPAKPEEVTIESFRAQAKALADAASRSVASSTKLANAITGMIDTGKFRVATKKAAT